MAARKASSSLLTHTRVWHRIDAQQQPPGRLAVQIVKLLQGKYKPVYHPAVDGGDHVVVVNTKGVRFSGRKWEEKIYRHHSGYPGGFREVQAKDLHAKDDTMVLRKAVSGMLAKNKLRSVFMDRLHLFSDEKTPYDANVTFEHAGPRLPVPDSPPMLRIFPGNVQIDPAKWQEAPMNLTKK